MRHLLGDTCLDVPRHLLSVILVGLDLQSDILQGEAEREALLGVVVTQSGIYG